MLGLYGFDDSSHLPPHWCTSTRQKNTVFTHETYHLKSQWDIFVNAVLQRRRCSYVPRCIMLFADDAKRSAVYSNCLLKKPAVFIQSSPGSKWKLLTVRCNLAALCVTKAWLIKKKNNSHGGRSSSQIKGNSQLSFAKARAKNPRDLKKKKVDGVLWSQLCAPCMQSALIVSTTKSCTASNNGKRGKYCTDFFSILLFKENKLNTFVVFFFFFFTSFTQQEKPNIFIFAVQVLWRNQND